MRDEEWRPVTGWEGLYEVSDLGRVRSLPRVVVHSNGRTQRVAGGILSTKTTDPYPRVRLTRNSRSSPRRVHVLVAAAFIGPCPPGEEVRHLDGNHEHASAGNLAYGTRAQNRADMTRHGRDHQRAKSSCNHGHTLRSPNLVAWHAARGLRACLACSRGRATVRDAAKRGVVLSLVAAADRHFAMIMEVA